MLKRACLKRACVLFVLLSLVASTPLARAQCEFRKGVVVSVSAPASDVGLQILKDGGNAVDAAVATAFALAVTHPAAGNIGGGGFMVVHPPKGDPVVFEYRETAPAKASKTMYKVGDSIHGHRPVGVPGTVRGMALAHGKLGKLPWKRVVQPAVSLARDGYLLDAAHARALNGILKKTKDFPELQRVMGRADGQPWQPGDRHQQPDLANTLQLIADKGPDAFYTGPIADKLVAEMKSGGGLITHEDLANYRAHERKPIHGVYRGYDIYGPPPPSSGGTVLVEMLNILENFDLKKHPRYAPETLHLMIEAMKRGYRDRAAYLGDPEFVKNPPFLTSRAYARKLAQSIPLTRATPSEDLAGDIKLAAEGDSTTHFSIVDGDGLAVSNTYTLEQSFGSRVVVKGAGFLLNNEMMDFNWRPGVTNREGTIGTLPNQIAPGKRMLSSQTPTIVARGGKVVLITGSPGGRTIINTVLNIIINIVDYEMPVAEAVAAPRLHHQWFPDKARFEALDDYPRTIKTLIGMGHRFEKARQGDAHTIWINPQTGSYVGAADHRISGKIAGW